MWCRQLKTLLSHKPYLAIYLQQLEFEISILVGFLLFFFLFVKRLTFRQWLICTKIFCCHGTLYKHAAISSTRMSFTDKDLIEINIEKGRYTYTYVMRIQYIYLYVYCRNWKAELEKKLWWYGKLMSILIDYFCAGLLPCYDYLYAYESFALG